MAKSSRRISRPRRLQLEPLESRSLLNGDPMISISDATAIEGSFAIKFIDALIAPGSGGLKEPRAIDYGLDGNFYLGRESYFTDPVQQGYVQRYDSTTGAFIDVFATDPTMTGAKDVEFGPDGNLYVPNNFGDNVYRFNGTTGAFIDVFIPAGSGGLDTPRSLIFGPDGNGDGNKDIYITSAQTDNILRFDGVTGAFMDAFVPSGSGGLDDPTALVFGPDGDLYVAHGAHSTFNNSILRYDGATGAFKGVFVPPGSGGLTLAPTAGVIFGPDANGDQALDMYVSNGAVDEVLIYNGLTGTYLQKYIPPGLGGLDDPKGLLFDQDGNLLVVNNGDYSVRRFGRSSQAVFTVSLSAPSSATVTVSYAVASGTATSGIDFLSSAGSITFAPGQTTRTLLVPSLDDTIYEGNETFVVNLSDPIGGVIADGEGLGTISDNEPAPQIVVADATATEGGTNYRYIDEFVGPDAYGLNAARVVSIGPDGNLYVPSQDNDLIKVFEANTGRFLRDLGTSGGELDGPWATVFGPDGHLYVGGNLSHNIIRFNIATGAYDVLVASDAGGLGAPKGLTFGPDGKLYASSVVGTIPNTIDTVKRFDPATGAYLGDFVAAGSGGLLNANGLAFGPDGNLYVASTRSSEIKRYSGTTGAYIDTFIAANYGGVGNPTNFEFRSDGYLYLVRNNNSIVYRYNATTGAFVDQFITNPTGIAAGSFAFGPGGECYVVLGTPTGVAGSRIVRYAPSSLAAFTTTLSASQGQKVSVNFATAAGTALAGPDYSTASGTFDFAPGETSRTILVRSLDDNIYEPTETFAFNLFNPVGGVIADAQAIGTILDNDPQPTKFYVADDNATNKTFEYAANGTAIENYAVNSSNSAPRGAASTIAGDKVWIVDANRNVYIYNTNGGLLGSWSASSLPANADVQGITTNGTDVWLVDAKGDKVYKYAGAAGRLSGSQTAASSFNLNGSNTSPTDLVTDGSSIWVLNNSTTDKIFKYTVSGSLLGSWTISSAGGNPTGLTIDPASVSSIWIVDSATDRVYEFGGAASRTSGSAAPTTSFALAAGNTNPQGIADPPATTALATRSSSSPDLSLDAALLGIVDELDGWLGTGGKKRG